MARGLDTARRLDVQHGGCFDVCNGSNIVLVSTQGHPHGAAIPLGVLWTDWRGPAPGTATLHTLAWNRDRSSEAELRRAVALLFGPEAART